MLLFDQLEYWHWFVLAVALVALEVFAPGTFLLWLGIAAGITGLALLLVADLGWQMQLVIFAVSSVVAIVSARLIVQRYPTKTADNTLNRRGTQYVGRTFVLDDDMQNGWGKIRVDDSIWKVRGGNYPAGTEVKVTGVDGIVLVVEGQG